MSKQKKNKDRKDEGNLYDKIFRENLEAIFLSLIEKRYDLKIKSAQPLPDKLQTTIERETDSFLLVETKSGEEMALHLEFQTTDDHSMIYRIAEHHGMRLRAHELRIKHIVIYLGKKPPTMPTRLPQEEIYEGFDLLDISQLDPEECLSSQIPEEIIMAILSNYERERTEVILRLLLKQLRLVCKTPNKLSKYTQQLVILSRLRNLESFTTKIVQEMPITYDIEKDGLYLQGMEKGEKRGEKKTLTIAITGFLKNTELLPKQIADILNTSLEFVLKVKEDLEKN